MVSLDEVTRVEERIAALMGVVNAATAELVRVIAEVLESGAWEGEGIRSPEHWVTWRCGVAPGRAARLVRMARRLTELPATAAAFEAGELSEDQAFVVAANVAPANDERAAEVARSATVAQLRILVRPMRAPAPEPAEDGEPGTPGQEDVLGFGYRDDGRWWIRGDLAPDLGAVVQRGLERARDAEFRLRHPSGGDAAGADGVTWVDALVRMADTNLVELAGAGRPADRFQVHVHVQADRPAVADLHLGPLLPSSVRRYLTCDATWRWVLEESGSLIGLSARQATVDDRLRAQIEHRDGGCRVPGCAQVRWLHIHHLHHREDGGQTVPSNLLALCPTHHRAHHHGRLHIRGDPTRGDGLVFTSSDGRILGPSPPRPPDRPPADAARALGLQLGDYQCPTGERLDHRSVAWN